MGGGILLLVRSETFLVGCVICFVGSEFFCGTGIFCGSFIFLCGCEVVLFLVCVRWIFLCSCGVEFFYGGGIFLYEWNIFYRNGIFLCGCNLFFCVGGIIECNFLVQMEFFFSVGGIIFFVWVEFFSV